MHCTSPGDSVSNDDNKDHINEHITTVVSSMTRNNNNNNDGTIINNDSFVIGKLQINGSAIQIDVDDSSCDGGGGASTIDVAQKIYDDPCELMMTEWPSPIHIPRSRSWLCCPNSVTIEGETPKLHRKISCEYSLVTEEPKPRNGGSTNACVREF